MKTSELEELKELSEKVVFTFPSHFTVDGRGTLYRVGVSEPITMLAVLAAIEMARDQLCLLDQTIQALEGRKAPK